MLDEFDEVSGVFHSLLDAVACEIGIIRCDRLERDAEEGVECRTADIDRGNPCGGKHHMLFLGVGGDVA